MTDHGDQPLMQRALDFAFSLDASELVAQHRAQKAKHPEANPRKLADELIRRARWKGVAVGFGTGFPSNPWTILPAAIADVGIVLRMEVILAARIAMLFDEQYLDDNNPPYEVMIPIAGGRAMAEAVKELAIAGGKGMTKQAIKAILTKQTLAQFKKLMLKWFGIKVGQRAIISKTLPIVGGAIGGGWNFVEVRAVGERSFRYFADREKPQEGTPVV